ncbi:MAG: hypothetical protein GEEBNDBF_01707 [bacterium]|nr:hypothetical protein [bacterium]
MDPLTLLAVALILLFVVFVLLFAFVLRIAKAGPNEALVVSGPRVNKGRRFRVVQGGTTWYFPLLERLDRLSLEILTLDVQTPPVYTSRGVPIVVDGIAQIKIDGNEMAIATAAEQFLSKTRPEIQRIALQTVEGHLRAILGKLTVEEVYSDRDKFASQVQETAAADLGNMGMKVVSFTIRDIRDEHGYLDALGKPQIALVKKEAIIGQADADAEAAQRSSEARRLAEEARFAAEAAISAAEARKNAAQGEAKFVAEAEVAANERDYQVKLAEYTAQVNKTKAEAELAYELQRNITAQQVKEQELQIQVVEKNKQLQIQQQEILRREKELEATVTKPAEAERLRIQTLAEAEKFQLETTARGAAESAKLRGFADAEVEKAQADARKVEGLVKAEILAAQGRSEAEVLRAKGLADAEVVLKRGEAEAEAMRLRAEAFKEYGAAAILEQLIDRLPDLARAISEPLAKTDKIVMINYGGGGQGSGQQGGGLASQVTKEVTDVMTQLPPVLEALTGIDFQTLMEQLPALKEAMAERAAANGASDGPEATPTDKATAYPAAIPGEVIAPGGTAPHVRPGIPE